jgi:hypothetical protein
MPISSSPDGQSLTPVSKATLLGSGHKVTVPSLIPEIQSIPAPHTASKTTPPGSLDMDWDDEEMSTQIYDRPDSASPSEMPKPLVSHKEAPTPIATKPVAVSAWPPGPQEPPRRAPRLEDELGSPSIPAPRGSFLRRNLAMGITAGAVVIAAIIAAILALSAEPRPGVIHLSTIPKDALVKLDNQPVAGSSSPFIILDVKPNIRHSLEVSKDGYESKYVDVKVEPDEILQLRELILRPVESGFTLDSSPSDAKVFVDGKELAQRTPVRVTALTEGAHQVRVEHEGYAPAESKIHVNIGAMLTLPNASLVPKKNVGTETKVLPKGTGSPKTANATTANAPYTPVRRQVVLLAQGTLQINTRPWSQVFVDNKLIGNTPQLNIKLEPGPHDVKLVNAEFHIQYSFTVDIPPGETVFKSIDLIAGN